MTLIIHWGFFLCTINIYRQILSASQISFVYFHKNSDSIPVFLMIDNKRWTINSAWVWRLLLFFFSCICIRTKTKCSTKFEFQARRISSCRILHHSVKSDTSFYHFEINLWCGFNLTATKLKPEKWPRYSDHFCICYLN